MDIDLLPAALVGLVSFAMGAVLSRWKARRPASRSPVAPNVWPLRPRSTVNSQELQVWRWLRKTFPEHVIAVKMPVTRFTLPLQGHSSKVLYRLLGGLYCTFAVCRGDGHVIACVDIAGPRGIKQSNRDVKSAVLGQCGIRYEILTPAVLPSPQEIRERLLGRPDSTLAEPSPEVFDAHRRLRSSITARRSRRQGAPAQESGFGSSEWQQPDSFIAPLDSRIAELA